MRGTKSFLLLESSGICSCAATIATRVNSCTPGVALAEAAADSVYYAAAEELNKTECAAGIL